MGITTKSMTQPQCLRSSLNQLTSFVGTKIVLLALVLLSIYTVVGAFSITTIHFHHPSLSSAPSSWSSNRFSSSRSQLWVASMADGGSGVAASSTASTSLDSEDSSSSSTKSTTMTHKRPQQQLQSTDLRRHQQVMEYILSEVVTPTDQRPIILFDGVCNLCNGSVNLAIDNDSQARFRFASLQSEVGKALKREYYINGNGSCGTGNSSQSSTSSSEDDVDEQKSDIGLFVPSPLSSSSSTTTISKAYFGSDAVVRILQGLDPPVVKMVGSLGILGPALLRDTIYNFISKNRHVLGESDGCRLDFDNEYGSRFVSDPPHQLSSEKSS